MSKQKVKELKATLEKSAGEHIGDVVWTEIADVDDAAFSRSAIAKMLQDAGLPTTLVGGEVSAQGALGRARTAMDDVPGYTVEPAKRRQQSLLIMRVEGSGTDTVKKTCAQLLIEEDGTLTYLASPNFDDGAREVFDKLNAKFAYYMDHVMHRDISRMVTRALTTEFRGVRLKASGHIYWAPASHSEDLRKFVGVIEQLGKSQLNVLPIYDTEESKLVAGRSMRANFLEEIDQLAERVRTLEDSGRKIREGTINRKLTDVGEIRERVKACKDVLGKQTAALEREMKKAEAAIKALSEQVSVGGFDDDDEDESE